MGDILDRFEALAESSERVAVGDMVDVIGTRSYGPFLIVPAMIELSPVGGVPGVPTALAAVVVLFALRFVLSLAPVQRCRGAAAPRVWSHRPRKLHHPVHLPRGAAVA